MTKQLLASVLVVCAAAACGSVSKNNDIDANGGDTAPAGDFALGLDMTSASSAITGSVNVTVSVTRGDGFADPIALTATGMPAGVTVNFGATSLATGTDSTMATLAIDLAANPGTTDITITGTAGEKTHSQTVSLELHTQTVAGNLRGNASGITVRIVGKPATTTDGTGSFTFTDVKVPYDLYVLGQRGTDSAPIPAVTYYKGLTRLDPVVFRLVPDCSGICVFLLDNKSSGITGSRFGAGTNAGPTYLRFTTANGYETNTTGSWNHNQTWFAVPTNNTNMGKLQGLQATRGTANAPTGWLFAESGTVTLTSGSSTNINLTLATLSTTAGLSGTITQPAGFPTPSVTLSQQLLGHAFEVWTATTTTATSVIPLLADQKASFYATSANGNGVTESIVPGITAATDVSMTLPLPPAITGPVNGASNVTTSTPFSFMTSANQVFELKMASSAAVYLIYTTSGSLTIPNLEEMPLPSATSFTWDIHGYGPAENVDAAADATALRGVSKFESTGAVHTQTTSPQRTFTTQ